MLVSFVLRFDHNSCIKERQQQIDRVVVFELQFWGFFGLLMDPGVAHRICSVCEQPRRRLFAYPRGQGLAEACAICWLANEICHLASQVEDSDLALKVRLGFWCWPTAIFASG